MLLEYVRIKSWDEGKPYKLLLAIVPAYFLPLPGQGGVPKRKEEANSAGIRTPASISYCGLRFFGVSSLESPL